MAVAVIDVRQVAVVSRRRNVDIACDRNNFYRDAEHNNQIQSRTFGVADMTEKLDRTIVAPETTIEYFILIAYIGS
jgi:hypothetical protein